MKGIVEKEWLFKNLHNPMVKIIDCRFSLSNPENGRNEYMKNHLPGAVYFDLEKDLSAAPEIHGGRHPLPDMSEFIQKIEVAGIGNSSQIVVYDNGEGSFAARFWWMMKYIGHKDVFVLNGGYRAWAANDFPAEQQIPSFKRTSYKPNFRRELMAEYKEVKELSSSHNPDKILIDSRETKRFSGMEEPIDKKAGRIPGAVNYPWFEGLREGFYKSVDEQRQRFSKIDKSKEVIIYCGSGVTAAPNFLALKEAGFENVKLYVGSFSDWISYDENPIETDKQDI